MIGFVMSVLIYHWFINIKSRPLLRSYLTVLWSTSFWKEILQFKKYCGKQSPPFCGATGTLCFGLKLTLSMDSKTRMNPLSLSLCSPFHIMSQLWFPRPGAGPNFIPWHSETTARVTAQCHFWDGWQIRTHDFPAQSPMLHPAEHPSN